MLLPCRHAASQLVALRTRLHRLRRERNQRHSVALNRTRWHAVALIGTQWQSAALSGNQRHSAALSGTRLGRDRLRLMLLATRLMRRGSRRIELARNVSSASEPAA